MIVLTVPLLGRAFQGNDSTLAGPFFMQQENAQSDRGFDVYGFLADVTAVQFESQRWTSEQKLELIVAADFEQVVCKGSA